MTSNRQNNCKMLDSSITAAASISDMARAVGLSRARFYQLVKEGIFPPPVYAIHSRRPFYTDQQQKICLEAKKMNMGINGRPVLFYSRKAPFKTTQPRPSSRRKTKSKQPAKWSGIIDGLKSLGLEGIKPGQIETIISSHYPSGTNDIDQGELLRTCYRALRRQNMCRNTEENV